MTATQDVTYKMGRSLPSLNASLPNRDEEDITVPKSVIKKLTSNILMKEKKLQFVKRIYSDRFDTVVLDFYQNASKTMDFALKFYKKFEGNQQKLYFSTAESRPGGELLLLGLQNENLCEVNAVYFFDPKTREIREVDQKASLVFLSEKNSHLIGFAVLMKYYKGFEDGFAVIKRLKSQNLRLSLSSISFIAGKILKGLAYLHKLKIRHRDVKPGNLLFDICTQEIKKIEVKIIDFGFAKVFNEMDPRYTRLGSPCYLAPEVIWSKPCECEPDIWAFGVTIFDLAFQRFLFISTNLSKLYSKIIKFAKNPKRLEGRDRFTSNLIGLRRESNPEVFDSKCFFDFLSKALIGNRKKRFSAIALLDHPFIKLSSSG